MVYRGRPSKSCRECRQRDIKCDKKKEGCSQCSRAGLRCSRLSRFQPRQSQSPASPVATMLLPTVEEQAKRFYVSQYITEPQATSVFSYMQTFYPPNSETPPLLVAAIHSIFMAFFSSSVDSQLSSYRARLQYGSALTLARSTVHSSNRAPLDTTLFSLLLLSVFDRILDSRRGDMSVSKYHLRGALGLVFLRGNRQFTDEIGITLFLQLTELIALDCLANQSDIPSQLLALVHSAQRSADTRSPKWVFTGVMLQLARLESALKSGLPSWQAVEWAEKLDQELVRLSAQISSHVPRCVGPQSLHLSDYHTTRCQNNMRVVRISLAEIVHQQLIHSLRLSPYDTSFPDRLLETRCKQSSLCLEIVHSTTRLSQETSFSGLSGVQTSTIFFHLYIAMESNASSNGMRSTILDDLETLKESQYYGHRKVMEELLQDLEQKPMNIWQVWLKIGKEGFSV